MACARGAAAGAEDAAAADDEEDEGFFAAGGMDEDKRAADGCGLAAVGEPTARGAAAGAFVIGRGAGALAAAGGGAATAPTLNIATTSASFCAWSRMEEAAAVDSVKPYIFLKAFKLTT